jgi:hypothetical protein
LTAIPKYEGNPLEILELLRFRYGVSVDGAAIHIVQDFSHHPAFSWRPELYEHQARVKVTVKNIDSKETAEGELPFRIVSRIKDKEPLATASPLVALFSAPPCPAGSQFRAVFRRQNEEVISQTPLQPCRDSLTNNVYVAGMRPESTYEIHGEVLAVERATPGPPVMFRTGARRRVLRSTRGRDCRRRQARSARISADLTALKMPTQRAMATDRHGNLVWYMPLHERSLMRMLPGGRFLVFGGGVNEENSRMQSLAELDLAGKPYARRISQRSPIN